MSEPKSMSERKGTKALELWCRRLLAGYDGISIDNMSTSWRNGLAFCALVHRFRPDLIDFDSLKADDIYLNNELAFRTAETHLGIPALLDPEDMVDSQVPDRLSILTYLSQFYQRLGHTVTKSPTNDIDNNNGVSSPDSTISPQSPLSIASSLKLSKGGYERCTMCGMPVYLAQRLMVSHKLYHRSCFRCSSCGVQLSPHGCYENATSTEFCCEACKCTVDLPALQHQDDRMGMLMFDEDTPQGRTSPVQHKTNNQSISDRIKLFETKGVTKSIKLPDTIRSWGPSERDVIDGKRISPVDSENLALETDSDSAVKVMNTSKIDDAHGDVALIEKSLNDEILTDSAYKSNMSMSKLSFLQTQLSTDTCLESSIMDKCEPKTHMHNKMFDVENKERCDDDSLRVKDNTSTSTCLESDSHIINSNIPDDVRLEEKFTQSCKIGESHKENDTVTADKECSTVQEMPVEIPIIIPPRRKNAANKKTLTKSKETDDNKKVQLVAKPTKDYPDDLNPFQDNEDEDIGVETNKSARTGTNPFGSSDDEDEEQTEVKKVTPTKIEQPRISSASNPFWSDGEEPASDEDESHQSLDTPRMYGKNSVTASTPNLPLTKPRRTKARAPKPPVIAVQEIPVIEIDDSYSLDDKASLSSMSSHCSTINSETKQSLKLTPKSRKKRPAPTPPDNTSIISTGSGSSKQPYTTLIQGKHLFADEPYSSPNSEGLWRRVKGPAPGLPLPGKRVVRPELSPAELQSHLDLLETQQLGLERQGVLIEQMIRDKCEGLLLAGEHACPAPAEEVEDLVIQLCELVNEKNDLFRKQAELMYIRRQQRLEQEQADIEHEIRIIQARPAVNRIDADKCREEQLVSRLVSVVRLRDELVQQLDSERRRERAEDAAIAICIAQRRVSQGAAGSRLVSVVRLRDELVHQLDSERRRKRAEDAAIAICIAQRRAKRNNSDSNNSSLQSDEVVRTPKKSKVKDRVKKQLKKAKNTLNIKKKESEGHNKDTGTEKKEKEKSKWF